MSHFLKMHFLKCRIPGRGELQLHLYGHTIGKLTHLQTEAGLSINKNRPIPRLCTIKYEPKLAKLQQVLFSFTKTTHSQVEKFTPIRRFLGLENSPILVAHSWCDPIGSAPTPQDPAVCLTSLTLTQSNNGRFR